MASKKIFATLSDSIRHSPALFIQALSWTLLQKFLMAALPLLLGKVLDFIPEWQHNSKQGFILLGSFLVLWIGILLLAPIQNFSLTQFTQKTVLHKTMEWFEKCLNKDLHFFFENNAARVTHIIERGIQAYEKLLHHFCDTLLPYTLELLITGTILYIYGGWPALIGVVVLGLGQSLLTRYLIAQRRHHIDEINEIEDTLAEESTELLQKGFIFQIHRSADYVLNRLYKNFSRYAETSANLSRSGSFLSLLTPSFQNVSTLAGLILGVISYQRGSATVGDIVVLIGLLGRVSAVLGDSIGSLRIFDQFLADIRALEALDTFPTITRAGALPEAPRSLHLRKGLLQNTGGRDLYISEDLTFKQNEKIAIIGESGSGKSTLLTSLFGVHTGTREQVLWDGQSLQSLSHEAQLSFSTYCPQEALIFPGTLEENILSGSLSTSSHLPFLLEKMNLVHLAQDRDSLTEGRISGGEAKRLSLLRSLNRSASLRFFDEPTSGLNLEGATAVWSLLLGETSLNTITFCTTHDLSSLPSFHRILHVQDGVVRELSISQCASF
ncbi:MAG: ABC transporter ATP-binding protein [Bdellovibrio sp.]